MKEGGLGFASHRGTRRLETERLISSTYKTKNKNKKTSTPRRGAAIKVDGEERDE